MTEGGLADWGSESGLCKLLCDRDLGRVKVDPDSSDSSDSYFFEPCFFSFLLLFIILLYI